MEGINNNSYFDRDLSWLSFNERILMEAGRVGVPVGERLSFLGIFASNLDEFYRVRMPAILALKALPANIATEGEVTPPENELLCQVRETIDRLQTNFGALMLQQILPELAGAGIDFQYNALLPAQIDPRIQAFFYEKVAAYLRMVWLPDPSLQQDVPPLKSSKKRPGFFPENDTIYLAVFGTRAGVEGMGIIRIPSVDCGRFLALEKTDHDKGRMDVWMLDDIIRMHLPRLAGSDDLTVDSSYSFKLTRDADIDYKDEYGKDVAGFIQKQIGKRSFGLATRLLYDASMPQPCLDRLLAVLQCPEATIVKGGRYHNLRDLMKFPVKGYHYKKWAPQRPAFAGYQVGEPAVSLLEQIDQKDLLISTPYQDYNTVLRYFNEAAIAPEVTHIAVTLYRIASDSLIAHALMTAAKNRKKVTVFVELKARFDEANNIKWAAMMKAAGVKIVYSIWALKVHAKVALVKRMKRGRVRYSGMVATGNFNETTAGLYADHILMTADREMTADMETLMIFLEKRARPDLYRFFQPRKLLIAGFNLQQVFLDRIKACTTAAINGQPASITLKLNNLEEEKLIDALYDASRAGVKIRLMVRSICRLIPGVPGMSERIEVFRLVDRYLEHSRVFIFETADMRAMYIGSADWMNRNIYRRIEVCCPVEDPAAAQVIRHIVELQFADQLHLVRLTSALKNEWVLPADDGRRAGASAGREAQRETYQFLAETREIKKQPTDGLSPARGTKADAQEK
ncbi:polyphosphate kinase 1 [Arachidicoccus terrestris]|uniref:polyphosphate kinase 1 n=1 Tax=Arachidicoccus terrestris TaxID=2875539 RepID=UPI001CC34843|nr:polyphosphate kinase 1 [Arachidicoccus terrestris]UAY56110.1 polyphosphate kinase 1 [Arachidicoccus terrestris]